MSKGPKVSPLEQARRDFKGSNPDLYRYITGLVAANVFDSYGDRQNDPGAANAAWRESAEWKKIAREMATRSSEQSTEKETR